jgi:RNA polymerase sigma-70 factor (ECF subfamily)
VSSSDDLRARFATTRWSVVVAAGNEESPAARAALSTLCETYWPPLYAFLRRQGHPAAEAQDLTQEFFATLLEKNFVEAADQDRGRFRTFLLVVLKRFLSKERDREQALKRGGGVVTLSLEFAAAEEQVRFEPSDDWTPEKEYERRWALTLLERVLKRLEAEYAARGKAELFARCRGWLTADAALSHEDVAAALGMTAGAIKVTVHRMRERYRELLREEIAQTVAAPEDVEEELKHLLAALRGESV